MDKIKDLVVFNVFQYLETKDLSFAIAAKENLEIMAKYYHIPIKKQIQAKDLKKSFLEFVLNGKGYSVTINSLYVQL
jgi:hypothetical protein